MRQLHCVVVVANLRYNGTVRPAGSTSCGLQGTWTTNDTKPAIYKLDGTACTSG